MSGLLEDGQALETKQSVNLDSEIQETERGQTIDAANEKEGKPRRSPVPFSDRTTKVVHILEACNAHDLVALKQLATSADGFVEDEIRKTAWPILLGCRTGEVQQDDSWTSLPVHRDEEQVKLDVNRSFVYYPSDQTEKQLDRRKEELSHLITEVLRRHPALCYFQGYHDIVQVLLLVLGPDMAAPAVARLSLLRIRDFMLPSFSAAFPHLELLPVILERADPTLRVHLSQTRPFFAISATLTLYAHEIQEYADIARLFDFLLAHEAVISVYLYAATIIARKDELLEVEPNDSDMLHYILSKLPKPLDLEMYIAIAMDLYSRHPPQSLPFGAWRRVSPYSVLKTTRNLKNLSNQTLQDGEALFSKQAAQIKRIETRQRMTVLIQKYQKPLGASGLTVLVGLLAWWLARNSALQLGLGLHAMFREPLRSIISVLRR